MKAFVIHASARGLARSSAAMAGMAMAGPVKAERHAQRGQADGGQDQRARAPSRKRGACLVREDSYPWGGFQKEGI
jgi:hypothetical protein